MSAGGCQYVIDGIRQGVRSGLTSSRSRHADLWRRLKHLFDDHGWQALDVVKVKAHRSKTQAEAEELMDDTTNGLWAGNDAADQLAKSLARDLWSRQRAEHEEAEQAVGSHGCLHHLCPAQVGRTEVAGYNQEEDD